MYTPYNLTRNESGYQFISDAGFTYILYFTEYFLIGENNKDVIVNSFGFLREPSDTKAPADERIKATIIAFITEYFEKNPEIGVVYICDTNDGHGLSRKRKFDRWHKEMSGIIEKFDCEEIHAREGYYVSILVRADCPGKQHYVDAFYRSLAEYFPEES